jgi:hypothetical protein
MNALLQVTRIDDVIFHRWYCGRCDAPSDATPVALRKNERQHCDGCGRVIKIEYGNVSTEARLP